MKTNPRRRRFSVLELLENRTLLSTYQVTTTADSGPGSLRDAITQANANAGADNIVFALPGSGVQVINLSSALPALTDSVTIDASASMVGGVPQVELNGGGMNVDGLDLLAANCSVVGLSIVGFNGDGVMAGGGQALIKNDWVGVAPDGSAGGNGEGVVLSSDGNTVQGSVISANFDSGVTLSGNANQVLGNMIGVDASGEVALGNLGNGVNLVSASHTTLRSNVISSNGGNGVRIQSSSFDVVAGNMIGVDAGGAAAMGNGGNGVSIVRGSSNETIGGMTVADRNVISGNFGNGVNFQSGVGAGNVVVGNFLGADALGFAAIANDGDGITDFSGGVTISGNLVSGNLGNGMSLYGNSDAVTDNVIGAAADGRSQLINVAGGGFSDGLWVEGSNNVIGTPGHGNVIAYNSGSGVEVFFGSGNSIRGNSMFANADLGIDLGADGYTANDSSGHDGSTNNFQNYPLFTTLTNVDGVLTISGTIDEGSDATYTIDFYSTGSSTADNHGQGGTYLGSVSVTTDATGHGTFSLAISNGSVPAGESFVVGTATDSIGNTSEFSLTAAIPPATYTKVDTSIALSSSSAASDFGKSITFTAVVTPVSGTQAVTGTVDFFEVGAGGMRTLLGTASVGGNQAVFATSLLSVGTHTVIAVYNGADHFQASTSNTVGETVNAPVQLGTISGHVYSDATGNGLSSDDTGLGGVTVQLFRDTNHNGVLDSRDALVATKVSGADGSYSFSGIAAGNYFVTEVTPNGYARTAPSAGKYYTEAINGQSVSSVDFDDFKKRDHKGTNNSPRKRHTLFSVKPVWRH